MLHCVRITNFKGFKQATIPLGHFTMLLGANASGKSNVRDALRFLHGLSRGYAVPEVIGERWAEGGVLQWKGMRGGTREVSFQGEPTFGLGIDLEVPGSEGETLKLEYSVQVTLGPLREGPHISREALYLDGVLVFDSHPPEEPPKQIDDEHIVVRLRRGGRNRRLGAAMAFLSSRAVLTQIAEKDALDNGPVKDAVCACLSALQRMRFFELTPDSMRAPSIPGQVGLGLRGENLSSVLMAICEQPERKAALIDGIQEFAALRVRDLVFPEDYSGKVLLHLVEDSGFRVSAHSASAGMLRFLAIFAAMSETDPGRFYFFEELENSIHPTRLRQMLELIERRCSSGSLQVAVTTQSAQLLAFGSESSRRSAVLIHRSQRRPDAQAVRLFELPNIDRVLVTRDLGQLQVCGWLQDAVEYLSTL